jgi:thiol:disulfide interchange protein DsbD
LIVGVAGGRSDMFQPLQPQGNYQTQTATAFKEVKNLAEFKQVLATAKVQNKIVLLDFYADWCVACEELERFTFSDPKVQTLLSQFIVVKVDVTANDEADQAFYKQFGLLGLGPPILLFFSPDGQILDAYRIFGFVAAEPFYEHLTNLLKVL